MMKNSIVLMIYFLVLKSAYGQKNSDSTYTATFKEVTIKSWQRKDITRLADEQNGFLNSGKKMKW